ncbi:hypothetical protein [Pantanalinema sp. GBBB05]|uniref:hypothetical protein n=1 Tax=Pantanalinema sp. GBBB05 TaxID=2604139 RepID=UPI001D40AFE7|nr:hypothetical protein [Pantanalinema sp. GBBB05]
MNLIQRILLICSAILASLSLLIPPVQAATVADLPNVTQAASIRVHANFPLVPSQASDHALINQGCACSSCLKATELLQGKLPIM